MSVPLPPIWIAVPPEVHSTLLTMGGTPAGIATAGTTWATTGAEYIASLAELQAILAYVQANYSGPSAEQFIAAHQPLMVWLDAVIIKAALASAAHGEIVAAYTGSVAAMPTIVELVENHVVHGVLIGTNFFGVNTVPIGLNEADYQRMWIEAAAVMSGWDASSTVALDSIPPTPMAPILLIPGVGETGSAAASAAQVVNISEGTAAGASLTGSDVIGTKLMVGKAATSPLSATQGISSGESGNNSALDNQAMKPESLMTGAMQQVTSMASPAVQAATSGLQGGPQQLMSTAPQMLSSAPQTLGQAISSFGQSAHSAGDAVPVGFPGTAAMRGINPAGLTSLAGSAFEAGPSRPLMPSTWGASAAAEAAPSAGRGFTAAVAQGAGMGAGGGMMGSGAHGGRSRSAGRTMTTYADRSALDAEAEANAADERRSA